MLFENRRTFSVDHGLAVLEAAAQSSGDYPTQFSMLAVPEDGCIYFTVQRDFQKRFKFTFADHFVRTQDGFAQAQEKMIGRSGMLLSELAAW